VLIAANLPGAGVDTIGRYQVRGVLGRGTTGVVYEAWDPAGKASLAVKLVTQPMRDTPALRGRLQRDAQAAAALGHPNLAAVVEVGEHEGQPFVATEIVPGFDLAQALRSRKPFPVEWTLDVWRQIAEGLAYAHRGGLLHLDLKPTDVRVTPEGDVKILDFGIAHLKSLERTGSGPAVGGVHYRAPEQVEGRRADARADVFSAAAIVYELAARRRAFPGENFTTVLLNITRGRPAPEALPRTAFSPGFEEILLKALARDPRDRYASFEDVHRDLVGLVREAAPRLRAERGALPAGAAAAGREELYLGLTRARAEGHMQQALELCQRLLESDPEDETARRAASEIEAVLQDREVEQLVGLALSYAADGEMELAARVAEKVEQVAPWSPRYLQLQVYLDEEGARRQADELAAAARAHLERGDASAAREAAQQALAILPGHASAQRVLSRLDPPGTSTPEPPVEEPPPPEPKARDPRRAEIESLTTAALDSFVGNDHERARAVIARVLALDPENRRARELLRILGVLG
jgi:tetratricopeptide (TPR) repeat protein